MEHNRKSEANQLKQWRQQWKVSCRKLDQSQKSTLKILSTFSDINPELSTKTNALITQHEVTAKKGEKESTVIYGKLKKINESIDQLRETLKFFDRTNQSLMKVQRLSQGIFGKMETMKNQMANSYDQLDQMERKFSSDLELIDRRIQAFDNEEQPEIDKPLPKKPKNKQNLSIENKPKLNSKNPHAQSQQQKQEPLKQKIAIIEHKMKLKQQQVQKVDEEVRELGKFLGWHEQDHKDFLTIWNRNQPNKNYFEIQDELVEYFKMYTNEQIIEHMNKYMKLKKLQDKKKLLINEYKQLKQDKKLEEIAKLKSNQQEKLVRIKKQEELRKAEEEQKEMKQKVELWKKQKEEMKMEEKRRMMEAQQRKKQEQMAQRRQQQFKRKEIMEKWRQQQQQKKQKQSKQPPKRPHSAVNKQTRERIKQRQQQIIRQKMQKAIQKKMQQQQLQKKAERIKEQKLVKYAHVNSKLDEKTTAIKEKERTKFDGKEKKDANTFGGQLLMTGVRAIPEWRQGL